MTAASALLEALDEAGALVDGRAHGRGVRARVRIVFVLRIRDALIAPLRKVVHALEHRLQRPGDMTLRGIHLLRQLVDAIP